MPLTVESIRRILLVHPGLDKRELLRELRAAGVVVEGVSDLNRFLYKHPGDFEWRPGTGEQRLWYIRGSQSQVATPIIARPTTPPVESLPLYPWQHRALEAWRSNGGKGVVEAVTGAGKTRLALQAMIEALAAGEKVVVIVPTKELMRQWHREIDTHVVPRVGRPVRVGSLGGGAAGNLHSEDVVVATAASASRWDLMSSQFQALLVADECHHYGADTWSQGLEDGFESRLGLTATYEREDHGIEEWLDPFFSGLCYSVGYEEALEDDVIAQFRIAFVGTRFDPAEQLVYEDASTKAGRFRSRLIDEFGLTAEPFGQFMRELQRLRHAEVPEGSRLAGLYLWAFHKRRKIMAEAGAKFELVAQLDAAVRTAERTIVFAQTVAAADQAIARLQDAGHSGVVIEASMDSEERRWAFDSFERGDYNVVAAPRLLDEGVDVPEADLAIVLATSRSRRQLIQRMGRVIRKKPDGRAARIAILYVAGTPEDPVLGAHEDFLDEVLTSAQDVRVFPPGSSVDELTQYLAP